MKNIINDENYDQYKLLSVMREYYVKCENADLVTNSPYYSKKDKLFENIALNIPAAFIGAVVISSAIMQNYLISIIAFIISIVVSYFSTSVLLKVLQNRLVNRLKNDYPELDYEIYQETLKRDLEKYEELSKVPKDIEVKCEEHLSSIEDNMRNLSTEEKKEYLQKELEFWNLVSIQEEYGDLDEDEKGHQKKISK